MDKGWVIGLDIGGTYLKATALSPDGTAVEETKIPSRANDSPESVRHGLQETVEFYKAKGINYQFVGIGCAGSIDPSAGVVRNSPNFSGWTNVPLKQWAEKDFGVPVTVDNDANCAVVTEWKMGAAKGLQHVLMLTFGTGVGGGLILDNHLYKGATGSASELGHFAIHAEGELCPCGHRGCFERYCSGSSLERRHPGSTAKQILQNATSEPYKTTIETYLDDLRSALTSLVNMFDPQMVLFGGGLSQSFGQFLPNLKAHLVEHAFPAVGPNVKLALTEHGTYSGAIGAALIAQECCGH